MLEVIANTKTLAFRFYQNLTFWVLTPKMCNQMLKAITTLSQGFTTVWLISSIASLEYSLQSISLWVSNDLHGCLRTQFWKHGEGLLSVAGKNCSLGSNLLLISVMELCPGHNFSTSKNLGAKRPYGDGLEWRQVLIYKDKPSTWYRRLE